MTVDTTSIYVSYWYNTIWPESMSSTSGTRSCIQYTASTLQLPYPN